MYCRGNVSPTSITSWQEERAKGPISVFKKPHKLLFSCNRGTRCCTASHRCVQTPSCLSRKLRWTDVVCCVVLLWPYCPRVFLVHSLAHSSQWFRYSVVSLSLNVARHRGHCRSDSPWPPCQVRFSAAVAAATTTDAAGFC